MKEQPERKRLTHREEEREEEREMKVTRQRQLLAREETQGGAERSRHIRAAGTDLRPLTGTDRTACKSG